MTSRKKSHVSGCLCQAGDACCSRCLMSLSREPPFRHKVLYSVDDGCSLRQKSIHHERENTMLFSSNLVLNGRPFLRCSTVWWQICWTDYRTCFEELMTENKSTFALRKCSWIVLKIYLFPVLHLRSNAWLLSYERTKTGVVVCKFYWEMDRKEKYWIKSVRDRSNLCLSRMFILLES